MTAEQCVVSELDVFRREVNVAAQFLYAQATINHRARTSKRVLRALNHTPLFWNTVTGALQLSAFIALGRIFDKRSPHNVSIVLRVFQDHPEVFSKDALAERKRRGSPNAHEWLPGYMVHVHVPTPQDFRRLRKAVAEHRGIYEAQFARIRNEFFAHKNVVEESDVATLFGSARTRDLERVVVFLNELHSALLELLQNGRKPVIRRILRAKPCPPAKLSTSVEPCPRNDRARGKGMHGRREVGGGREPEACKAWIYEKGRQSLCLCRQARRPDLETRAIARKA